MRGPRQGDTLLLNTAPQSGRERADRRPYIVLSYDIVAGYGNIVTATPISSATRNYPLYVSINPEYGIKTTGKVLLNQLTAVGYETRECIFSGRAHDSSVEESLVKIRTVSQKISKWNRDSSMINYS